MCLTSQLENINKFYYPMETKHGLWPLFRVLTHSIDNLRKTPCTMGNSDTKLNFRKAVIQLTTKSQVYSWKQNTYLTDITFRIVVSISKILLRVWLVHCVLIIMHINATYVSHVNFNIGQYNCDFTIYYSSLYFLFPSATFIWPQLRFLSFL